MFSRVQHPYRHVWDFWYYFDSQTSLYHIFYLNADKSSVYNSQYHFTSCVGHATTKDFLSINWREHNSFDILRPPINHWANTSIWSGDIIKINNGFLLFYTSRNRSQDDGMTQNIGVAYNTDLNRDNWHISPLRIQPGHSYQLKHLSGDISTHAWRDPFLFQENSQVYMLVSAKLNDAEIGRNGVVGLLKLKNNDFSQGEWEYLDPLLVPYAYSEMEVPQLYKNPLGEYELVFSSWAKNDFSPITNQTGGLQGFRGSSLQKLHNNPYVLMPEKAGLYACRIIPELDGEIIGFDIRRGGIRRSGIKTHFNHINRDFTAFSF